MSEPRNRLVRVTLRGDVWAHIGHRYISAIEQMPAGDREQALMHYYIATVLGRAAEEGAPATLDNTVMDLQERARKLLMRAGYDTVDELAEDVGQEIAPGLIEHSVKRVDAVEKADWLVS